MRTLEKMKAAAEHYKLNDCPILVNPSSVLELIARLEAADEEIKSLRIQIAELKAENERLSADNELLRNLSFRDERDELTRQLAELVTAIDEHLVVAHIGVFNQGDDPKAALNKIACYEQSVGDYFGKEALRKELAECKADAARLDYLQQGVTIDLVGKDLLFRVGGDNSSMRTTIREAIDAAMKGATE